MEPSPQHDASPACVFCRRGMPTIAYLFRTLDGSTICDRCVELLAQELRTLRQRGETRETDHLRLRIRITSPQEYAAVAAAVGEWGQRLCEAGAVSRLGSVLTKTMPTCSRSASESRVRAEAIVCIVAGQMSGQCV